MRFFAFMCLFTAAFLCTGCGVSRSAPSVTVCPYPLSTALLFNRDDALPSTALVAGRSHWPAARAYQRLDEEIFYRERFIDWQGPGHRGLDHTYRRFDTYRQGYGQR